MQASLPLGVDDMTRIEIENNICREAGPLPDCFSSPMEHVLCLFEEVCLVSLVHHCFLDNCLLTMLDC